MIDGFILSAGLGTRMGALSRVLPKPAWTLRGRPLILWGAEDLRREGFRSLACNAHHLADRLAACLEGSELRVFPEPELLGSAGGLGHVRDLAAEPLAVWNGDALAQVPWGPFLAEHRDRGADLSWLLVPHDGGPWNPVHLDDEGRVLPQGARGRGPYHFTGATLWSRKALKLLPQGPCDLKRDLLPRLGLHAGIVAAPFPWREVGTPGDLIAAAAELAPRDEGRLPGCYVHPSARLEGIGPGQLEGCVLGPGAAPPPGLRDRNALWFAEAGHQVRLAI